ncbi:MAG: FAD-binding oxidoreductase [Saprospiraceae bacterium]|nr:FAD-binding oxidoreductase [Saprospiraceae bacterium]
MDLNKALENILPQNRIKGRLIDRYAFASDAGSYYMVPQVVVQPDTIEEIKSLFAFSSDNKIPMTFRAAGTSLCGQGVTDGMLVDLSRHWRHIVVEDGGFRLRVEPAVIGGHANLILKRFGRKIGPDPASINAAMMGGILSNNSSGMCCGVHHNSYHTVSAVKFVLPNGMVFSTENKEDYTRFQKEAKDISDGLLTLRNEILQNDDLIQKIRRKYRQKNTTGYSLNAFLDYENPLDIFAHLLIGAEGTLAFIAEAVLNTIPDYAFKMTGMLYFETPEMACQSILLLKESGAEALEFMDRASLRSVENMAGIPGIVRLLPAKASAILTEYQADTESELLTKWENAIGVIEGLPLIHDHDFTRDPDRQAALWKIRKGMYPSVAGMRNSGTAMLLEDLTFPVERLGEAIKDVRDMFEKYDYENGIIFGHAKDGNLHFCISQHFDTDEQIERFRKFNDELFDLVLGKYDGALKAEHGTGRAVAPYVEAEWGKEAYGIMLKLKKLVDPENLLNPNVILSNNKNEHVQNLKSLPVVEEEVDKCVECGFCENRCPSRDFTMTPRQRIGIRRALQRLKKEKKMDIYHEISKDYEFDGLDTCAVDGMCATDCPVSINTGELVKRLRRENHSDFANKVALTVSKNFSLVQFTARLALKAGFLANQIFGRKSMSNLTKLLRQPFGGFPLWSNAMDKPPKLSYNAATHYPAGTKDADTIVYFPTCINRMMGGDLMDTFLRVCKKVDIQVVIHQNINSLCCGQIFSSKGHHAAYKDMINKTVSGLWSVTQEGKLPVMIDVTSCTFTLQHCRSHLTVNNQEKFDKLKIYDTIDFSSDVLLQKLKIINKKDKIVFHPVCSIYKMGLFSKLEYIGKACATDSEIPAIAGCCGTAGDRGFYIPELPKAATKKEAYEVNKQDYDGYYSTARTCEMSLTEAVGKNYQSIIKLLDEVSEW